MWRPSLAHYNAGRGLGERILAERAGGEIGEERLAALLGPAAKTTPLAHYLGVRTWFWRITVTGPSRRLVWIVARLPGDAVTVGEDKARLQVVEEQWAAR